MVCDSKMVRVKLEVEELVSRVAELLGYQRYTIRNYALLLGVIEILEDLRNYGDVVLDDVRFKAIINNARKLLDEVA